ncbi:MAG TPA: hypothetical protein VJ982_05735 [Gemmatimonadota bacterium]|nr:hypothetical protein [Gemmatimonadota bacterium]
MTRQSRRAAAFLVALLLVMTSLGTALGAHPCPRHDGVAGAAGPEAAHGADARSGHEHDADPGSETHGPCTCVGHCQAAAAPSMPAAAIGTALPTPPASPHAFRAVRPLARASIVPFSLPWGNAPPTL